MTITNGAAVTNALGFVGSAATPGTVTVDGAGSSWGNSSTLWVYPMGTLTITGGASVSSVGAFVVPVSDDAGGLSVAGAGSTWTISGDVLVAGSDTSSKTDVAISDGGLADMTGTLMLNASSVFAVDDATAEAGALQYVAAGAMRLCDGGMMNVSGAATFHAAGGIEFGLSGAATESQLAVGGLATLTGGLDVSLLGGYMPSPGSWFTLIDAGSLAGTFGAVAFPNYQQWGIDYDTLAGDVAVQFVRRLGDFDGDNDADADDVDILANAIAAASTDLQYDVNGDTFIDEDDLIEHVAALVERTHGGVGTYRGDFNLDGYVNATDLAIFKAGFGLTGLGYAAGNCNTDDFIDGTDLAIFKATFGLSGTPTPGTEVPEPATMALLALGGAVLLRRRN